MNEEKILDSYVEFCKENNFKINSESLGEYLSYIINLVQDKANINY